MQTSPSQPTEPQNTPSQGPVPSPQRQEQNQALKIVLIIVTVFGIFGLLSTIAFGIIFASVTSSFNGLFSGITQTVDKAFSAAAEQAKKDREDLKVFKETVLYPLCTARGTLSDSLYQKYFTPNFRQKYNLNEAKLMLYGQVFPEGFDCQSLHGELKNSETIYKVNTETGSNLYYYGYYSDGDEQKKVYIYFNKAENQITDIRLTAPSESSSTSSKAR